MVCFSEFHLDIHDVSVPYWRVCGVVGERGMRVVCWCESVVIFGWSVLGVKPSWEICISDDLLSVLIILHQVTVLVVWSSFKEFDDPEGVIACSDDHQVTLNVVLRADTDRGVLDARGLWCVRGEMFVAPWCPWP